MTIAESIDKEALGQRWFDRRHITLFVTAILICLGFAAYTQHEWEDYWITFRASRNLAEGNGFVFTPGERLHPFTSPLGTLLPAGLSWVAANQADHGVLWAFRVISAGALGAGLVLLYQVLTSLRLKFLSCWLTIGLIALDAKVVDFTINGMETRFMILFLGLAIHGLIVPGARQILRLGVASAGLMWSRPDSCVYIAALGIGAWLFLRKASDAPPKSPLWKNLLFALLICAAFYLPWLLLASYYYGSPVPHTDVAKT